LHEEWCGFIGSIHHLVIAFAVLFVAAKYLAKEIGLDGTTSGSSERWLTIANAYDASRMLLAR
jgi:hypothetical protein